jgi:hypothetical protein
MAQAPPWRRRTGFMRFFGEKLFAAMVVALKAGSY